MINGLVAYIELEHEIVKWTSSIANSLALICIYGVALRKMAQRNVEWYSVHTNGVVLCRIALQSITRSSSTSNCLAVHEIFRCCGKSSSLLVAWRKGYLAETTKSTNRKWNSDLLEAWRQRLVWSLCLTGFTSPCRKAEPIRNFSVSFSSFFPADIHIYSLSFMKALIEIATRLNSTTVFRPPGLSQFARVC